MVERDKNVIIRDQNAVQIQEPLNASHCEFITVDEIQNSDQENRVEVVNCNEQVFTEEVCNPVMEVGCQEEVPVFSVTEVNSVDENNEVTIACESTDFDVCEVDCFETAAPLNFEVATVDSMDDSTNSSVSSEDFVKTVNTEIVMMDCSEIIMTAEEVPSNPQQNALIRRG